MDNQIKRMDLESKDLVAERIEQMKALFPEIATEGNGSIDFEKLRLILGDEVDEGDERYAFTWPGKADAIRQSQTVSTATLRPCPEESVDWDTTQNLYIEGDNLEVLKLLQRGYHGKIKMIYIDPPYNTGKDFVYKDKFGDTIENYKEQMGLVGQSNADTSGSYHSVWCSMMYPRLKLARELLTEEGAIFISIDDHEYVNVSKMLDEVFGASNHLVTFVWSSKGSGAYDSAQFKTEHEYVVGYARNSQLFVASKTPYDTSEDPAYNLMDERFEIAGKYKRQALAMGTLSYSASLDYPVVCPDGSELYPGGKYGPPYAWRYSREKMKKALNEGFAEIVKTRNGWSVFSKQYERMDGEGNLIRREKPIASMDLSALNRNGTELVKSLFGYKAFSYPKPIDVPQFLIDAIPMNDDIVLDFFSGSATTAHALMKINAEDGGNRRCILVQIPESLSEKSEARSRGFTNLAQVGKERWRIAGERIASEVEESNRRLKLGEEPKSVPDVGFRVLKLDESGIAKPEPGQLMLDRIKPDRSDEDIIFEMMLKWGYELTYPIEKTEVGGYPCYSVAADSLICCMQEGLTVQALQAIADLDPDRVLILDSILDDTLELNALQIFKRAEERTQEKIDLRTV